MNSRVTKIFTILFTTVIFSGCTLFNSNTDNTEKDFESIPTEPPVAGKETTTISFDNSEYTTDDPIIITYKIQGDIIGLPWLGLVPTDTPHTRIDSEKESLAGKIIQTGDGTLPVDAIPMPGSYEARIYGFDLDAAEVEFAASSITINPSPDRTVSGTVSIDKNEVNPGDKFTVTYSLIDSKDPSAWIGLVPSKVLHGKSSVNSKYALVPKYLGNTEEGELEFVAPETPGKYDIRLNSSDTNEKGYEISYETLTVLGEIPEEPTGTPVENPTESPTPVPPPAGIQETQLPN